MGRRTGSGRHRGVERDAQIPLPARLDPSRWEWPMTGREAELDTLLGELGCSAEGRRCILVGGEPGIGKTRLVAEFAATAHDAGAVVLLGGAHPELEKPYLPFVEAYSHSLENLPAETLAGSPVELAELGRLVPQAREVLGEPVHPKNSPGSEQFALFRAGLSLLRLLSRRRPVVLVLEDLHWADDGTLLMLQYLVGGRGEFPGLIVATARSTEVQPGGGFSRAVAQLRREPNFRELGMAGLSESETLALLTSLAGHGMRGHDARLAEALSRETAGNPFYVSELVASMISSGMLAEVEGRWRMRGEVEAAPLTAALRDSIRERVRILGEDAESAMRAAAVAGVEFDPALVERAVGQGPEKAAASWTAAERAGLLAAAPDSARFVHPLARRVLAEEVSPRERAELEGRRLERAAAPKPSGPRKGVCERLGDGWAIRLEDSEVRLRDSKGVRYLARLLASPGVELHAADLQADRPVGPSADLPDAAAAGLKLQWGGGGDAGAVLDETAKREYRARVASLEAEVEEAERFNDPERAAMAQEELDFIARELAAAVGLGGRDRRAASEAERARVNVTRAIRSVLNRIEEYDGTLGGQLKVAVRTGTFCCYEPVPGYAVSWEVMEGR